MPFIDVKTNVKLAESAMEEIKTDLGQAITAIPGKSEGWLMVGINDEYDLWFRGKKDPAAMVDVSVYGSASSSALNDLTSRITAILSGKAGISPDHIYVKYALTNDWGWNGNNF